MRVCMMVTLLTLTWSSLGLAGSPLDITGYGDARFGMTPAEVIKVYPQALRGTMTTVHGEEVPAMYFNRELLGVPCEVGFKFDPSRGLGYVQLSMEQTLGGADLFSCSVKLVTTKYGEPVVVSENLAGWKDPDGDLIGVVAANGRVSVMYVAHWHIEDNERKDAVTAREF